MGLGRTGLTEMFGLIFPTNKSKQIKAKNHRKALNDFSDSVFNLKDDKLENIKYNDTNTLAQYLQNIISNVVKKGKAIDIDAGGDKGTTYSVEGVVLKAEITENVGADCILEITFNQNISEKTLIPVLYAHPDELWNNNNDVIMTLQKNSATKINLLLREVSNNSIQKMTVEFILI
ncbi:hypothetical protein ACFSTE_13290 [Aquimarina hainanensis]|uniref:Uncharacterized protein n=1 Tax=Aquimarina hainanensis TaxID=1578017 RepID=A0ABW5N8L8_9FLAO